MGVVVGGAELIARYKDDPWGVLRTLPGISYLLINGLIATAAYFAGFHYLADQQDQDTGVVYFSDWSLLLLIVGSGLGGLAIFRSKIFTLRVGDADIGVGPSFILDTILQAVDRAVARRQAVPRSNLVRDIMDGVSFENARTTLPAYCLALMQNVSEGEQSLLGVYITRIEQQDVPDIVKNDMLCLALLDLFGEKVLRTAVRNIKSSLAIKSELLEALQDQFVGMEYHKALAGLPPICAQIKPVPEQSVEDMRQRMLDFEGKEFSDRTKLIMLGFELSALFGWEIVECALRILEKD
ncbi:MAG: hypothetical protein DHS20C03_15120 [Minwuia thermotolerans]|nr:MAG: hypothetical protein DHS20C03_15120 [Minwuia thermotolerans]